MGGFGRIFQGLNGSILKIKLFLDRLDSYLQFEAAKRWKTSHKYTFCEFLKKFDLALFSAHLSVIVKAMVVGRTGHSEPSIWTS